VIILTITKDAKIIEKNRGEPIDSAILVTPNAAIIARGTYRNSMNRKGSTNGTILLMDNTRISESAAIHARIWSRSILRQ